MNEMPSSMVPSEQVPDAPRGLMARLRNFLTGLIIAGPIAT